MANLKSAKAEARREAILEAALRLLQEKGARALTLDAVAQKAGTSKGGLVYHFSTKEALVRGLVAAATHVLTSSIRSAYETSKDRSPGSFTRIYVEKSLQYANEGYLLPLFELAAGNPALAAPLAEHNEWCHKHLENDGIEPVLAHVIASAADGLWLEIVFRLESPTSWRVAAMRSHLLELTRAAKGLTTD